MALLICLIFSARAGAARAGAIDIVVKAGGLLLARAARALAARARMFATSQVPFFPSQQYKLYFPAVCTLIYMLN
jgi:hypothetical protein